MLKKLLILLISLLLISPLIASPNIYTGHIEVSIEQTEPNFLQTFLSYFRLWEQSTNRIAVSWVTFEKDLGGDLSKYYSPNSYKLFQAHQLGCTIKTNFVVKNTATQVTQGYMVNTNIYDMGGSNGWKAESLGYYDVSDGPYLITATTLATCPSGVSNPMATYDVGGLFYKSGTIQIGTTPPPPCAKEGESCGYSATAPECCSGLICKNFQCVTSCDVGSKCGEFYVELDCKDGDVYRKYEVWRLNSDCDCVFDSYWYDLDEPCDYGCTENAYGASCNPEPVCTTIGVECKREFIENFCKNNDIYKKESVYRYDSNCNCVFEELDESFIESCPYGCSNGICLSQPVKKSDGDSCDTNTDCLSGNCLSEGVCGPIGYECWTDDGCDAGYNCISGLCVLSVQPKQQDGDSCDTNTDCLSGNCLSEGVCGPIGYECWTNAGCGAGETCISGKCEAVCTPHCEGFYWWDCENNMPVNKGILIDKCGVKCISDGDCLSGYVCDGYVCVEKVGWKSFGEFCTSDDECISGYCLDSEVVCVPVGWECYTGAGCMPGYDCVGGECIEEIIPISIPPIGIPIIDGGLKPVGSTCYSDGECISYNCIENICVVAGVECITDAGCGVNEMCSEGKCIPVPEFPSWILIIVGGLIIGVIIIGVMFLFLKK